MRNGAGGGRGRGSLWSPRFPKAKELGWWVMVGTDGGLLLAVKKVGLGGHGDHNITLSFEAPPDLPIGPVTLSLHVVPDGAMGLDHETRCEGVVVRQGNKMAY
ncbi:unnamed protein product [Discosporangium mesarthrocarpum]